MKGKTYYSAVLSQLRQYSGQLNEMIEYGSFYRLPFSKRYLLIRRVKHLYNKLRGPVSEAKLRYVLAGAALLVLGFSCKKPGPPSGPDVIGFKAPSQNPFGISPNAVTWSAPTFVNLDGDGDQDLFVGEYGGNIQYFENTGTAGSPAFAAPLANQFGITARTGFALPAFVDIDGDGDQDLFVGESGGNIQYFRNLDDSGPLSFDTPTQNPFSLTNTYVYSSLAFADIDGDGDQDLFAGEYYGNIQYFENTGTPLAPAFDTAVQNPFGLAATSYFAFLAFADIDDDGDMDLFAGEAYGNIQYFENSGSAGIPAFEAPQVNPYNLASVDFFALPAFVDIDNDGDMDLFAGEKTQNIQYFENTTH